MRLGNAVRSGYVVREVETSRVTILYHYRISMKKVYEIYTFCSYRIQICMRYK